MPQFQQQQQQQTPSFFSPPASSPPPLPELPTRFIDPSRRLSNPPSRYDDFSTRFPEPQTPYADIASYSSSPRFREYLSTYNATQWPAEAGSSSSNPLSPNFGGSSSSFLGLSNGSNFLSMPSPSSNYMPSIPQQISPPMTTFTAPSGLPAFLPSPSLGFPSLPQTCEAASPGLYDFDRPAWPPQNPYAGSSSRGHFSFE